MWIGHCKCEFRGHFCYTVDSVKSASGRSWFPALQCGTTFRLTSHQRRHSRFSDSASSRFCSLSLIRTSIPDSHSLHLCGTSNNWHYLGHTKHMMMMTMMMMKVVKIRAHLQHQRLTTNQDSDAIEMAEGERPRGRQARRWSDDIIDAAVPLWA